MKIADKVSSVLVLALPHLFFFFLLALPHLNDQTVYKSQVILEMKSEFSKIVNKLHHGDHNRELWIICPHSSGRGDLGTVFAEVILGNINDKGNRG